MIFKPFLGLTLSDLQSCMDEEETWMDNYGRGCIGSLKKTYLCLF